MWGRGLAAGSCVSYYDGGEVGGRKMVMGDKRSKRRVAGDGRCHGTALHYNLLPRGGVAKNRLACRLFFCACGWSSAPQSESPRTRLENALGKVLDNRFGYEEEKKRKWNLIRGVL